MMSLMCHSNEFRQLSCSRFCVENTNRINSISIWMEAYVRVNFKLTKYSGVPYIQQREVVPPGEMKAGFKSYFFIQNPIEQFRQEDRKIGQEIVVRCVLYRERYFLQQYLSGANKHKIKFFEQQLIILPFLSMAESRKLESCITLHF